MDLIELKAKAVAAAADLQAVYKDLKNIKGIRGAVQCAGYVVPYIEKQHSALAGVDKKALAVEIILALVPMPPWLPELVVRPILSWIIEKAVAAMKKLAARL